MLGGKADDEYADSCLRYDIMSDEWTDIPSLNVARKRSGSCHLNGRIYAFAGKGESDLNSIEMLITDPMASSWKLIQAPKLFSPRTCPIVAPLNQEEIVIIGGK